MRLADIKNRLDAATGSPLKDVLLALTRGAARAMPAAYIVPLAESVSGNELWGGLMVQQITARFGIEYVTQHPNRAETGAQTTEAIEDCREFGFATFLGWQPGQDMTPIEFSGGRLVAYDPGVAVWRDEFTTTFYREVRP